MSIIISGTICSDGILFLISLLISFYYITKWLVGLVSSNSSKLKGSANGSSSGGTDFMQEFFAKVETVKSNISLIKDATKDIADINQNVLQATTNEREQDYSNKLGTGYY